ncbi:GntR family transcriptional regulator [Deltaproteobacteria bacterium OttesenSCG-928-M10]|nr:GntR family transcriptional regulator [Deltaproteobacteria bacterium OttesenSCG-928-M10]
MAKKTLQQTAYDIIRSRIISCEYQPGSFLNTLELQDKLGVSRTPIREALARLEQDNLVNFYPNKGFFVTNISLAMISDIYETRILIEPHIVVNYGGLVNKGDLEIMGAIFRQGLNEDNPAGDDYMARDDDFHALLRSACPNIYLVQALDQIAAQAQRVRIISGYVGVKLKRLCREHLDIVEAILEGRLPAAGKLMTSHLIKARKNAFLAPRLAR